MVKSNELPLDKICETCKHYDPEYGYCTKDPEWAYTTESFDTCDDWEGLLWNLKKGETKW